MEREKTKKMTVDEAEKILGDNFIGPRQLNKISDILRIPKIEESEKNIPQISCTSEFLSASKNNFILILGCSHHLGGEKLTLKSLRDIFGVDPSVAEPCFYNQDWYLKEKFFTEESLQFRWYFLAKNVIEASRAVDPEKILLQNSICGDFPAAILTAFAFFSYYLLNGSLLWENDFVWCSSVDGNGDRIYTGRYLDPVGLSKNGFNIHRHLKIKKNYGLAPEVSGCF